MPKLSPARLDAVLRATKRWQNDLVDTSGRNRFRRYRDLGIQAPPGTGKSQTIVNLITALIAQGKRVPFCWAIAL